MASPTDLARAIEAQWQLLRSRLAEMMASSLAVPSAVPGWNAAEVLAHLGTSMALLGRCEIVKDAKDLTQLTLTDYLSTYAASAGDIDQHAHQLARESEEAPIEAATAKLDAAIELLPRFAQAGPSALVHTRRGAIPVVDFLYTRLIEIVVHSYDLAPAMAAPAPVEASARHLVSEVFAQMVSARVSRRLIPDNEELWIQAAAGRASWDEAAAAGALRPEYLSDGVPDLSAELPLV